MNTRQPASTEFQTEPCKRILAVVPDDGTDRRLLMALRQVRGVNRVESTSVRSLAMLQKVRTGRDRLPEPSLAKLVAAVVAEADADAVFDFMFEAANIGRLGGGTLMMHRLVGATPFDLPMDLPDEAD